MNNSLYVLLILSVAVPMITLGVFGIIGFILLIKDKHEENAEMKVMLDEYRERKRREDFMEKCTKLTILQQIKAIKALIDLNTALDEYNNDEKRGRKNDRY